MMDAKDQACAFKYQLETIDSPFWVFAIHDGHLIDEALLPYLQLDEPTRLREEDPYTGIISELPFNRFVAGTSRFQLDINRKKEDAIYLHPEQAWGLKVWKDNLPENLVAALQSQYDIVYNCIDAVIKETIDQYGYFVIYDVHSYNARRDGPSTSINTSLNPQINLGTAYNDPRWRELTGSLVECLTHGTSHDFDVRENIKFKGGYLSQYINQRYGKYGCVFSIELRKDFMDEWTGTPYPDKIQEYKQLLLQAVTPLKKFFDHGK